MCVYANVFAAHMLFMLPHVCQNMSILTLVFGHQSKLDEESCAYFESLPKFGRYLI